MRPLQGRFIYAALEMIGASPYPIICAPYRGNASACERQRTRTPSPERAQRSQPRVSSAAQPRCVTLGHDPGGGHLACKVSTTPIRCADLTGQLTPVGIYTQGYVRRCAPSSPWAATVAPFQGLPCACSAPACRAIVVPVCRAIVAPEGGAYYSVGVYPYV